MIISHFRLAQNAASTFSIVISNNKHWGLVSSLCLPWGNNRQYEEYGIQVWAHGSVTVIFQLPNPEHGLWGQDC